MAGRPVMMARRVLRLEERASALSDELAQAVPEQYVDSSSGARGPLADAWIEAFVELESGVQAIRELGDLLREKAERHQARNAPVAASNVVQGDDDDAWAPEPAEMPTLSDE